MLAGAWCCRGRAAPRFERPSTAVVGARPLSGLGPGIPAFTRHATDAAD